MVAWGRLSRWGDTGIAHSRIETGGGHACATSDRCGTVCSSSKRWLC